MQLYILIDYMNVFVYTFQFVLAMLLMFGGLSGNYFKEKYYLVYGLFPSSGI